MADKEIFTKIGQTYAILSKTGCTVSCYAPDGTLVQQAEVPAETSTWVPAHTQRMVVSDEDAFVTEAFNAAPAAVVGGGGASPSPLDPAKPLASGKAYTLSVTEDTDLSALTVADDATAEIWLSYSEGSVTWPSAWVWGTDTFDSSAPDSAPDFAAGEFYCIVVRRYAARGLVIATLSHTVK